MQEKRYVFGYGSILNPASMAKDIDAKHFVRWATLKGYERIFDWPVDGSLALNLRVNSAAKIDGTLIEVDDESFEALKKREKGYEPQDVASLMQEPADGKVFAFIAPNEPHLEMHISRDYYELCLAAIPDSLKEKWLATVIIQNPIQ